MRYQDEEFIATSDLLFEGVLRDVRKSREALQPIYEALTNAFEAIKCRIDKDKVLIYISTLENHRKAGVGKFPNQPFLFI